MKVLVTGGAGYIGSTICNALKDSGHVPIVLDSLVNGRSEYCDGLFFYKADISNKAIVNQIFIDHPDIYATIHCAALVFVPESVISPYKYFNENFVKSIKFFYQLKTLGTTRLVFSSSASIYEKVPGFKVTESSPVNPVSPYSRSKLMVEMALQDFSMAYDFKGIALRYFNPIGADPKLRSGLQYKNSSRILDQLILSMNDSKKIFNVTGVNWPTRDGSGIRDYIHVWDLAMAHVKAVEKFETIINQVRSSPYPNYGVINLGAGDGVTVLELLNSFQKVTGKEIKIEKKPPRPGDVAGAYADSTKAQDLLNWNADKSLDQAINDELNWRVVRNDKFGY